MNHDRDAGLQHGRDILDFFVADGDAPGGPVPFLAHQLVAFRKRDADPLLPLLS